MEFDQGNVENLELLQRYLFGELSEEEKKSVEKLLEEKPLLREELNFFQEMETVSNHKDFLELNNEIKAYTADLSIEPDAELLEETEEKGAKKVDNKAIKGNKLGKLLLGGIIAAATIIIVIRQADIIRYALSLIIRPSFLMRYTTRPSRRVAQQKIAKSPKRTSLSVKHNKRFVMLSR